MVRSPVAEPVVIHGDMLSVLVDFPAASISAVVTDPPYGLAFAGQSWDRFRPTQFQAQAREWGLALLRVMKPGAHLLAFGSPRTFHRLAVGFEDAGLEIRDCLMWLHGQGMPTSAARCCGR